MDRISSQPALPPDMALLAERLASEDADTRRFALMEPLPPPDKLAAVRAALEAHERAGARPVSEAAVAEWLGTLATSVSNRPDDAARRGRLAGVMLVCRESETPIPGVVLTPALLAESVRRFKFWPSVAELVELLEQHAKRWRATGDGLRRIIAMAEAPAEAAPMHPRPPLTDDEQAAMDRTMAPVREAAGRLEEADKVRLRPRPHYLSREQLRAHYAPLAAAGDRAAITRLNMLEREAAR